MATRELFERSPLNLYILGGDALPCTFQDWVGEITRHCHFGTFLKFPFSPSGGSGDVLRVIGVPMGIVPPSVARRNGNHEIIFSPSTFWSRIDRVTDSKKTVLPDAPPSPPLAPDSTGKRRVAAMVALSLLEVIRVRDLPTEILGSEDPAQTLPRRLGLSEAVELQIRRYREEVRKRRRISDAEARDLFHLVLRRPDSEEVFFQTGEMLAGKDVQVGGLKGLLPGRIRYALARREVERRIRALFGRSLGGYAHGRFALEARGHFFLEMDPGGDACALVSGLAQTILTRYLRSPVPVIHDRCEARKHDLCRWVATETRS